jgi:glucose-6-phosphate dehydrogenase assembly protein OpcA
MAAPVTGAAPDAAVAWDGHVESAVGLADRLGALAAARGGGAPVARAAVLNLVAVPPPGEAAEVEALIESLAGHQPSRAIVVERVADGTGIDAHLESRTGGGPGAVALVELVRLALHGDAALGAGSAVRALLRPDLPVFLWWPGAPEPTDPVLAELAAGADRLVTECARAADAEGALAHLARVVREGRAAVTDLAWAALTPWRQLVHQLVGADEVEILRRGGLARIGHCCAEVTAEALLLAGWLRDGLGRDLRVALEPCPEVPRGGVAELHVEAPGGRRLSIRRRPDRPAADVTVHDPAGPARGRTLPLPTRDRAALLAGELELQRRDRPFERALPLALELTTA